MSFVSLALALVVVIVVALVVGSLRVFGPGLVRAFDTFAMSVASKEQRDALYAAVKIGLRVANLNGLDMGQLVNEAVAIASRYLQEHGIHVSPELLTQLVNAEYFKVNYEQPVAHLEQFTATVAQPHASAE